MSLTLSNPAMAQEESETDLAKKNDGLYVAESGNPQAAEGDYRRGLRTQQHTGGWLTTAKMKEADGW